MKKVVLIALLMATTFLVACGASVDDPPVTLTLMSHDSFFVSEEILANFTEETGVLIELLPAGDAGEALNQAILAKDDPLADVFFGVDNTFLGRALEEEIFLEYDSPLLEEIPDEFELDSSHHLLPVDYGDVCLNYDIAYFADNGLEVPTSLVDLADPAYAGLLVVMNPATSSPGLAFLLATIDQFGTEGDYTYLDFWSDLRDNDVLVVNGWSDAYYGSFTVASDGDRPMVVSYATSPPAEVLFADPPVDESPSGSVSSPGTCFRQIEFIGILDGTEHEEEAQMLIDYMLSVPFQEDIPLNMFVFPANENAELPEVFIEHGEIAQSPATVDPAEVDANRDDWIEAWTDTVLR